MPFKHRNCLSSGQRCSCESWSSTRSHSWRCCSRTSGMKIGKSGESIIFCMHRFLPTADRLESILRLFRITLDVTSPSFAVEDRQWGPSVADVFYHFFSVMWTDDKVSLLHLAADLVPGLNLYPGRDSPSCGYLVSNSATPSSRCHHALLE